MMKQFKASYTTQRKAPALNSYFKEIIKAKGIMHANKIAESHAKVLKTTLNSLYEVIENE